MLTDHDTRQRSFYSHIDTGPDKETLTDIRPNREAINLSKVSFKGDGKVDNQSKRVMNSTVSNAELTLLSISTKKSIESLGFSKAPSMVSYKEKHDRSRKLIMRGRNPLTVPRNTEMWHLYKESSLRTDLVGKGRAVFDLARDIDSSRKNQITNGKKLKLMHGSQHSPYLEKIPDRFRFVGNMKIDMETEDRVNFGNLVCLINTQNEVLCVDPDNHFYVKNLDDIGDNERIAFKVIDLNDLENSKSVEMGQQMWFQLSPSITEEEEAASFAKSTVLATKVSGPPVLGKLKLTDNAEIDDSGLEKPLHGKVSAGNEDDKFRLEYTIGLEDTSYGPGSCPTALQAVGRRSKIADGGWAASGKLMGGANMPAVDSGSGPKLGGDVEVANSTNHDKLIQKEKDDRTAEIVGGLQAIRTVNFKLFESEDGTIEEASSTRYRSMESFNMGRWICYHAGNDNPEDPGYLNILCDIYLQQDLYCLSSEANLPLWPERALDVVQESPEEQVEHHKYEKEIRERVEAINAIEEREEELRKLEEQRKRDVYEQAKSEVLKHYTVESNKSMEELVDVEIRKIEKRRLELSSSESSTRSEVEIRPITGNSNALSAVPSRTSTAQRSIKSNPSKASLTTHEAIHEDIGDAEDEKEMSRIDRDDSVGSVVTEDQTKESSPFTLESMHQEVERRLKLTQGRTRRNLSTRQPEVGCVRRVVNRVPPYPYKIEQKCVWRFLLVNTAKSKDGTDLKNVNASKMTDPNSVLLKARYALGDSKLRRMGGGKSHNVKHLIPKDVKQAYTIKKQKERKARKDNSPVMFEKNEDDDKNFVDAVKDREESIPQGEKFTLALNMAVSQHSFKLECSRLSERREKEKNLTKLFQQLIPSTRKLIDGDKSLRKKKYDFTKGNTSSYSDPSLFGDDMSLSTLDTNMDDSISVQSVSSDASHIDLKGGRRDKTLGRGGFHADLQNTHEGHYGRTRANSLHDKEKPKHPHDHASSRSTKHHKMEKIEWNTKKKYQEYFQKVHSMPSLKDLTHAASSDRPELDDFGNQLISLHTELAASNIKRSQELSSVKKNMVQLDKEREINAHLHEKHHRKLKLFEDCDLQISEALIHKDRMEKYQKLQGLLEDDVMDDDDELKLSSNGNI